MTSRGILRVVSAPTAEVLAESLAPLTGDPAHAAVFCDIDGTLAPIVRRPEESHVREEISLLLGRLGRRYGCVACVSGRPASEARRLVGVGSIAYVGSHGAELMPAGANRPSLVEAFASWEGRVRALRARASRSAAICGCLRIRVEDKGPIKAFHWRGAPDEAAAETWLTGVAQEAEADGLRIHWGRKVLEIRPPVHVDKGEGITALLEGAPVRAALYGGDDVTDLDAFDALDELVRRRATRRGRAGGRALERGPGRDRRARGHRGRRCLRVHRRARRTSPRHEVHGVPARLRAAVRRRRHRARGGGHRRARPRMTTPSRSAWPWAGGRWRRPGGSGSAGGWDPPRGSAGCSSNARATNTLPELEPGAVLFNRLWPLAVFTIGSGALAFLIPQVPAIAAGYAIGVALTWRKQSAAVQAIEDRDGVRFFFDRSSPFGAPQLLRTPWARKIEPVPEAVEEARATG